MGSDDLPRIQAVRVPCLLNAAACCLQLAEPKHARSTEQQPQHAAERLAFGDSKRPHHLQFVLV